MNKIGIRHEDKYTAERRAPLAPRHVARLVRDVNLKFVVQHSPKRVFGHDEYLAAGATISDSLEECQVVMGVKEIPLEAFEAGKTYIFFSHVIKSQPYNMPMLRKMMELKCTLIDYEKIEDELGRRLIFFGRFAGLAGMINTFWSLGQRLKQQGIDTPFTALRQAVTYSSLAEARQALSRVGFEIARHGLPEALRPFTIGFTGYGNVSNGAQEIAHLMPIKEVTPEELLTLEGRSDLPGNVMYKTIFREKDLVEPIDPEAAFELQHYYKNPHLYRSRFAQYVPRLSVLVNGMYWDARYPRLVTKEHLKELYAAGEPRLKVIGDITCDVDGSIESTVRAAPVEDPVFVYNPATDQIVSGFEGPGIQMMTVDILPTELPREASIAFGDALLPYMEAIAKADFSKPFLHLDLPNPILRGMILYKGELTPDFTNIRVNESKVES
jgi:saccharopine dehydrogenase (NAD+, L-lysine forming)